MNAENPMKLSRPAYKRADALKLFHLMGYCGATALRITGKRGNWLVSSMATEWTIAKFASIEARDVLEKERQDAAKRNK